MQKNIVISRHEGFEVFASHWFVTRRAWRGKLALEVALVDFCVDPLELRVINSIAILVYEGRAEGGEKENELWEDFGVSFEIYRVAYACDCNLWLYLVFFLL